MSKKAKQPPATDDITHSVHTGMIWIQAAPEQMTLLLNDSALSKLIAVKVTPDTIGILPKNQEKLVARLSKLNQFPSIRGRE